MLSHEPANQRMRHASVYGACALQGTKPEVRTYNTIISACNRSGQPESALRVYERMLADGAQPTAATYTALISAYGKTGKARATAPLAPLMQPAPIILSAVPLSTSAKSGGGRSRLPGRHDADCVERG